MLGPQGADDGIGTFNCLPDGVGIGHFADDVADIAVPGWRNLGGVARMGSHGMAVGEELADGERSDGTGSAEDCDVHRFFPVVDLFQSPGFSWR